MEHRHNHLEGRLMQFRMLVNRDATTIILYGYRVVGIDYHLNVGTVTSHSLIDGVIHGLVYEVVQSLL